MKANEKRHGKHQIRTASTRVLRPRFPRRGNLAIVLLATICLLFASSPVVLAKGTVEYYGGCRIGTSDSTSYYIYDGTLGTIAANGRPQWYSKTALTSIRFSSNVKLPADASSLFASMTAVKSLTGFNNVSSPDTTNMASLFEGSAVLTSVVATGLTTDKVTNMNAMFKGCSKLATLDLSSFDTSAVTTATDMFNGCTALATITVGSGWSFEGATGSRIAGLNFPSNYNWKATTGEFAGRIYAAADVPSNVAATYTRTTAAPTPDVQIEVVVPLSVPLLVAGDGSVANAVFDIENQTVGAAIRVSQISFTKASSVAQAISYDSIQSQQDAVGMRLQTDAGGSVDLLNNAQITPDASSWTIAENGRLGMTLKTKIGGYGALDPVAKTPIGQISYTFSVA